MIVGCPAQQVWLPSGCMACPLPSGFQLNSCFCSTHMQAFSTETLTCVDDPSFMVQVGLNSALMLYSMVVLFYTLVRLRNKQAITGAIALAVSQLGTGLMAAYWTALDSTWTGIMTLNIFGMFVTNFSLLWFQMLQFNASSTNKPTLPFLCSSSPQKPFVLVTVLFGVVYLGVPLFADFSQKTVPMLAFILPPVFDALNLLFVIPIFVNALKLKRASKRHLFLGASNFVVFVGAVLIQTIAQPLIFFWQQKSQPYNVIFETTMHILTFFYTFTQAAQTTAVLMLVTKADDPKQDQKIQYI